MERIMIKKNRIKEILFNLLSRNTANEDTKISSYLKGGRIPWSEGYSEYKYKYIKDSISSDEVLCYFKKKVLPDNFGQGLDERSVEYPWIFHKLSSSRSLILDAGSTFNFDYIIDHSFVKNKELTIYTFFPEENCFFKNRISYVYGDLRRLYFKNETFNEIVSQSTIEHIDMDNSIYGYDGKKNEKTEKSFEYLNAIVELIRVLKSEGKLLITFPFGKYENHGFFQQFDFEMLRKLLDLFDEIGKVDIDYFKYEKGGWRFAQQTELLDVESFNPHTGKGKGDDGAAHCRSIACIEFVKK